MYTIATTHSGGEGVGVGASAAGLKHLWGVEWDADIAGVANANGFRSIVSAVECVNLRELDVPDVLHSSPVCKNASVAKNKRGEQVSDIESGQTIVRYIEYLRPKIFTLENVYGYRKFEAFKLICDALTRLHYVWDVKHVNAADFGVPQTRKRLILRATRYGKKRLPDYPDAEKWVGWYEAIEDLIPTLPESKFAPWQLARLPEEIQESFIANNQHDEPAGQGSPQIRRAYEPMTPIRASGSEGRTRAFIANTREMHDHREENALTVRNGEQPLMTLSATGAPARLKAFIADGKLNDHSTSLTTREGEHPMFTLSTSHNMRDVKAFVMPGGNSSNENPARTADEPITTIQGMQRNNGTIRAWLSSGRVVAMTPRCLARFQSFPDSYLLPDKKALAATVIGNAVPPLLYQKIIVRLVDTL